MGCILKGGGGLYSRVTVGAVLLAAGSGSRMGHRPKSLLELGGVPLIRRQLIALSGAGVDEVVVVLGHYADRIEEAVKEFPVTLVRNPQPDQGQVSSQRLGLQALSGKLDAVIVALADQPLVGEQDYNDLIGAYKPGMREVDDTAMARARLFVDSRTTTIHHIGELIDPLKSGAITESHIVADFYDDPALYTRQSDDEITIAKNGGGAHLDLMTASYIASMWGQR